MVNEINWEHVSKFQKLPEAFIREFQDKVNWNIVLISQKLSKAFIREFADKLGK